MNKEELLAELLYTNYCDYVGGVAYNGDPLPNWKTFSNDDSKFVQATAWRRIAVDAIKALSE